MTLNSLIKANILKPTNREREKKGRDKTRTGTAFGPNFSSLGVEFFQDVE